MLEKGRPNQTQEIITTLKIVCPLIATAFLSFYAFDFTTRREIGRRDRWTCQAPCCNREFRDGYMVTAAHYPELHGRRNHDPDAGRMLCQLHHAMEELERGNTYGAEKCLEMGIFTEKFAQELGHNVFLTVQQLTELTHEELMELTEAPIPVELPKQRSFAFSTK